MGKQLISRDERIAKARKWRKEMNKRHRIETKERAIREMKILKLIGVRGDMQGLRIQSERLKNETVKAS